MLKSYVETIYIDWTAFGEDLESLEYMQILKHTSV